MGHGLSVLDVLNVLNVLNVLEKSRTHSCEWVLGGPGRSRTFDRRIKSPLLYQLSYEP